jgi:hypothetical protein
MPGRRSGEHKYRATAGAKPRPGNSRFRYVADLRIDARAQTGTAPDEHSELRLNSANQSVITDVSRFRSHHCTIIACPGSNDTRQESVRLRARGLTWDIRAKPIMAAPREGKMMGFAALYPSYSVIATLPAPPAC